MIEPFLGIPWEIWGILSLLIAAVYLVLWPRPRGQAAAVARPGWRNLILRWFHSLVWVLLAISFFVRATQPALANSLALLALLTYIVFLTTFALERSAGR